MVTRKITVPTDAPPPRKKPPRPAAAQNNALTRFEESFSKVFGAGSLVAFSGSSKPSYEVISTGSLELDIAIGVGGMLTGRCQELWGAPGAGKTTTALMAMAQAQQQFPDRSVAFVDAEGTFDLDWAVAHGVDPARLRMVPNDLVDTAEKVSDAMFMLVDSGLFSMVVLDSVGALIPQEEFIKAADEATVGTKAKVITRMVLKVAPRARRHRCAVVFINQLRAIVGPKGGNTTGGGFGLKHVSTIQLYYREIGGGKKVKIDGEEVEVAKTVAIKVVKNKVAPPNMSAEVTFVHLASKKFGPVGVDKVTEAWNIGTRKGVITRQGAYYTLPCGERFQGGDPAQAYLAAHPEEVESIRTKVLESLAANVVDDLPEDTEPQVDVDEVTEQSLVELDEVNA